VQPRALAAEQLDHGEADGIGAPRRSGGEDAVGAVVRGRCAQQFEALRAVEFPEDEEVGDAFDVGEAGLELGQDLQRTLGLVLGAQSLWGLRRSPDRDF